MKKSLLDRDFFAYFENFVTMKTMEVVMLAGTDSVSSVNKIFLFLPVSRLLFKASH